MQLKVGIGSEKRADHGQQPLVQLQGKHVMRRLTQVFGHGAAARADFQHVILRAHAAQAHQFLQQRLIIDKVLAQALLIA